MKSHFDRAAGDFWRIAGAIVLALTCGFAADADELNRIGSGTAIVFSPDFSDPDNERFYERLGFLYIESPDWWAVLDRIRAHNADPLLEPVEVLVVESHGTNGHGLKLQSSKKPSDPRSYISVGALQENLAGTGVELVILSACNSGRLLRPEIYSALDRSVRDPLFLPATLEIIDASPEFDAARSPVKVLRRVESNLETLLHAGTDELAPIARSALHAPNDSWRFAVSSMLIQLLTRDSSLALIDEGYVREKSRAELSAEQHEKLFENFALFLERRASIEARADEAEDLAVVSRALFEARSAP
ncbi:MAG: hypothetical protein KY459_05545 [Acidobacteria bacterium]|nr:hypothetical protein [Acidobacteriota bacterium]